jgi:hypothetical protein
MKKLLNFSFLFLISAFANSQSKVIVEDYTNLKKELTSIRSEAEQYATDIKKSWVNDTAIIKGKMLYIKLAASADGIIEAFKMVIKKPKTLNQSMKETFSKDLDRLKEKLTAFGEHYINGNLKPGDLPQETSLRSLFEMGKGLFEDIKKILTAQREEVANQLSIDCKFKPWEEL